MLAREREEGVVIDITDGHAHLEEGAPPTGRLLTLLLALSSLAAGTLTATLPGLLAGPPVMDGSARGTGAVVALVAVPTLVWSSRAHRHGSWRGAAVATGATAYLAYNAVMFCFATPFNQLFPLYVVMLGSAAFLLAAQVGALARWTPDGPSRALRRVGAWILLVVVLNGSLWALQVLDGILAAAPGEALAGSGLTTNPVWVQDLAVWLPAMAWVGLGALGVVRPRPALVAAGLAFWVVESVGVAVDQAWGHHADPASRWASPGAVWLFAVTAVLDLALLLVVLAELPRRRRVASPTATGVARSRVG